MIPRRLDGRLAAAALRAETARAAGRLRRRGVTPGLAVIQIGDDPASRVYIGQKRKACEALGFQFAWRHLPAHCTESALLRLIGRLNRDRAVHGILVQLPLPGHLDSERILRAIAPEKDVDGLHPENLGRLTRLRSLEKAERDGWLLPCTPYGVIRLLRHYGVPLAGRRAVIVGRSALVGKPLALLLLASDATVTVCHSRTRRLADMTRTADILIAAVGKPGLITARHVRKGAVVVDVGINSVGGRLKGDVVFPSVRRRAGAVSPVPGGVGPMTVAALLRNLVRAASA